MADGVHVRVGAGRYAFDVRDVREVEERQRVTAVPGAPAGVLGVCNLRGAVLPVVEINALLGQAGDSDGGRFIVVTAADGFVAGVTVDEILGVEPLPGDLEDEPTAGVRGRALVDGELIGVLDIGEILRALADASDG
jgi:purine-binding chemotaxis protein CheW